MDIQVIELLYMYILFMCKFNSIVHFFPRTRFEAKYKTKLEKKLRDTKYLITRLLKINILLYSLVKKFF